MKKLTKKYYFSVEGDTEVWYLDWLRDMINSVPERNQKMQNQVCLRPILQI